MLVFILFLTVLASPFTLLAADVPMPNQSSAPQIIHQLPPDVSINPHSLEFLLYRNRVVTHHLTVTNSGDEAIGFRMDFDVTDRPEGEIPENWFSIEPAEFEVPAGQRQVLDVTARSAGLPFGQYSIDINFFPDDPDMAEIVLMAEAEMIRVAGIDIDPNFIEHQFALEEEVVDFPISVHNIGDIDLNGRVEMEIINVPDDTPDGWIEFAPNEFHVAPGEESVITFTVRTEGLRGGDYEVGLHFISNDPDFPDMVINVLGRILGIPNIDIHWDDNAGFPDVIDWNQMYPDVFTLIPYEIPAVIFNTGNEVLVIGDIFVEGEAFSVDFFREAIIQPGQSFDFDIVFNTEETGEYRGVLHICSNDPDENELEIPLVAEAVLPPWIAVNPERIEEFMWAGQVEDCELTVSNEGESTLRFQVEHEINGEPERDHQARDVRRVGEAGPQRDEAGDLIATINGINAADNYTHAAGYDWDNGWMWFTSYTSNFVRAYSFDDDYNVQLELNIDLANPMDGAWLNGIFFTSTFNNATLQRFDSQGNNLGQTNLGVPTTGYGADAEEGLLFTMEQGNNQQIHVYPVDEDGALGDQIGLINNYNPWGNAHIYTMEWVAKHPEGQLWITNGNGGNAYQIAVDTDEWQAIEMVQSFRVGSAMPYDPVAHDGHNLWCSDYTSAEVRIYDDGIAEHYWLTYEPDEGEVGPGEETVVTVTLNTTGLFGGEYEAELIILSNDPHEPEHRVPVSFFMEGPMGIMPEWQEEFGYPDVIDFNGGYQDVFTGRRYAVPVEIYNDGVNVLTIEDIFTDNEYFHAELDIFELEPGDSEEFEVIFECDADESGDYNATLVIVTNDANQWEIDIPLHAEATELELIEQRIQLSEGWNMISINVDPIDFYADLGAGYGVDYVSMFQQLVGEDGNHGVNVMKDENGHFWSPLWGFTNIPYWNLTEGYQLRVNNDCEVILPGIPIPADADIPINPGWNMIAYFPNYDLDASDESDFYVLSPIIESIQLAKDGSGFFMTPDWGFSNMPPWTAGQGYQVKSIAEEEFILNYPPEQEQVASLGSDQPHEVVFSVNSPVNMSLLVQLPTAQSGKVQAVDAAGKLIGEGIIDNDGRCGLAVWGDDILTSEREGLTTGEAFSLRLIEANGDVLSLDVVNILTGDGLVYQTDGFVAIDAAVGVVIPQDYTLSAAYPNPFNSTTTIGYSLPVAGIVSLVVYDLSGREVARLVDGVMSAGTHEAVWVADGMASGVYVVCLDAGGGMLREKVVLVK